MKKKIVSIIVFIFILIILFFTYNPITNELNDREPQLSAYSDDWNGVSKFRKDVEKKKFETNCIISSPLILNDTKNPEKTLYIAIGIEKKYDNSEILALIDFVGKGGKILIADDFGYANSISKEYGIEFYGKRLYDINYEGNTSFIKIDANMSFGNFNLTFDRPTALKIEPVETEEITKLTYSVSPKNQTNILSDKQSWIDENDDGAIDFTEKISEPLPLIKHVEKLEEPFGSIVFISDSSLFINDMWDKSDNAEFSLELVDFLLPNGGEVIFDESRHTQKDLTSNIYRTTFELFVFSSRNIFIKIILIFGTILLIGIVSVAIKEAKKLEHEFDPTYKKEVTLIIEKVKPERIRKIFLNKLRMWHAMPDDEFSKLDDNSINRMIGDQELIDFINKPNSYKKEKLVKIVEKISRWGQ